MIATALGPDPFPRLAAIALIVLAITLAGRTLIWWRGSSISAAGISPGHDREAHARQTGLSGWPLTTLSYLVLACWSLLAWVPAGGLVRLAIEDVSYLNDLRPHARLRLVDFPRLMTTYPTPRLVAHSAILGLGVVALLSLLAWRPSPGPPGTLARACRKAQAFLVVLVAPLIAGVGVLAIGRTAMLCRDSAQSVLNGQSLGCGWNASRWHSILSGFRVSCSSWAIAWRSCRAGWPPGWRLRRGTSPVQGALTS